jgi:hypothetical protein
MMMNESRAAQEDLNAPDCPFIGRCSCWDRRSPCHEGPNDGLTEEREAACTARTRSTSASHTQGDAEAAR